MAKKDLSSLVNGIIGKDQAENSVPNPVTKKSVGRPKNESQQEEVRTTLVLDKDILRKIKFMAVADECLIKDIINNALKASIKQWESKRGEINLP